MTASTPKDPPLFFLDSSAFLNGADRPPARCRTTPGILAEFRPGGRSYDRVQRFLAAGMTVEEPRPVDAKRVETAARGAGSLGRLSRADLELVSAALAHPDAARIVSDDYTVQDLAKRLELAVESVHTEGIVGTKDWVARCAGCGRTYPAERASQPCPVCGSEVRLKPRRPAAGRARETSRRNGP